MGCGYSKINISSRKGKLKIRTRVDPEDCEDYNGTFSPGKFKKVNGKTPSPESIKRNGTPLNTEESLASRRRIAHKIKPISGPMRPPLNRSESQEDFFKMLDDKIANGRDLDFDGRPMDNNEVDDETVVQQLVSRPGSWSPSTSSEHSNKEDKHLEIVCENPGTDGLLASCNQAVEEVGHQFDNDDGGDPNLFSTSVCRVNSSSPSSFSKNKSPNSSSVSSSSPRFRSDRQNSHYDTNSDSVSQTMDTVCPENAISLNSDTVDSQTVLNNCETSNDNGANPDLSDKVDTIISSSLRLSNGQVLS